MKLVDTLLLGFVIGAAAFASSHHRRPRKLVVHQAKADPGTAKIQNYVAGLVAGEKLSVPFLQQMSSTFWASDNWTTVKH